MHDFRTIAGRTSLLAVAAALLAAPAAAQETETAAEPAFDIVVTASRTQRDGFTAPTPTTVLGSAAIEARGATNVANVLNEIPAFKSSTAPTTNGVRAIFAGAYFADLRGLGSSRTLVLVDGNRFVPQISTGISGYQVDLNQVPSLLLERAEVVTGGASAQWGSDAVAGVVNLILKKDFDGLNAEGQWGLSEVGDNVEYRLGFVAGKNFGGGRGNITLAIDHVANDGIGDVFTRDWGRQGYGLVANPSRPTNGLASTLIMADVRNSTMTSGGMINNVSGPASQLRGTTFLPGGQLGQFGYGNFVGSTFMVGGTSNAGQNFNTGVSIAPSVRRWIGYGRASYEVADDVVIYGEFSYAKTSGRAQTLPARNEQATPIVIRLDNPFIPQALRDKINTLNALPQNANNKIVTFNVGRNSEDLGYQRSHIINETKRGVLGVDAGLGGDWKVSGALIYGENRYEQNVAHNRIRANFNYAADVVMTANGPACRAVVQGIAAAAGCVPLNIFGEGSPSQAAIDYVTGTTFSETTYKQFAANVNLDGTVFHTWAGPVSLAVGAEYRKEEQDTYVDPIAEAAGYESSNARSLTGEFNVKEAYMEVVVPLARDIPVLQSLDVQGAVRFTDYSTMGSVTTWKAGVTWEPFDGLLVRGNISRDIRAPNIFELVTPAVSTILTRNWNTGVNGGPAGQLATENLTRGNADLDAERATTKTIGLSWTPGFARSLRLSVDYFDIKLKGAVAILDPNVVINFCNGTTSTTPEQRAYYCSFITYNPGNTAAVYTVDNPYLNIGEIRRSGVDFAASYRVPLDLFSASGGLTFNLAGTRVIHFGENVNNAGFIERAGEISASGSPKWITTSSISYDDDALTLMLQMRHFSSGNYNNLYTEGVQINNNHVPGAAYFNLSATYRASRNIEFFGVVNNLLD